mgnify:FL=1
MKVLLLLLFCFCSLRAEPPFWGTIFIDPDIIKPSDPSAYLALKDAGQAHRTMYDRRENNWVRLNPYLFNATYKDGLKIEVQVNPEFGNADDARKEAEKYADVIGQLTTALRRDVETVWIHKGVNPFGGGNNNLLIHTGQALKYINDGILEETFVHEATHTSLDSRHAKRPKWIAAQKSDDEFISNYAKDHPNREDVAESYLPYFAIRYRPDRISKSLARKIKQAIPNRIKYFDSLSLEMYPVIRREAPSVDQLFYSEAKKMMSISWSSQLGAKYIIQSSSDFSVWKTVISHLIADTSLTSVSVNLDRKVNTQEFYRVGLE